MSNKSKYLLDNADLSGVEDIVVELMNPNIGQFDLYLKAREMAQRILFIVYPDGYFEDNVIDCWKVHGHFIARVYLTKLNTGKEGINEYKSSYSRKGLYGWETNLEGSESFLMHNYLLIEELCKIMFAEVSGVKDTFKMWRMFNAIEIVTSFIIFQPKIMLGVIEKENCNRYQMGDKKLSLTSIGVAFNIPLYQSIIAVNHIKTYMMLNELTGNTKPFWEQQDWKRMGHALEVASN